MAEKKELTIEMELDTSRIDGKSGSTSNKIKKDMDKVSQGAEKASSSIDGIADSLSKAGNNASTATGKMANGLKNVKTQADAVTKSLSNVEKLQKAAAITQGIAGAGGLVQGASGLLGASKGVQEGIGTTFESMGQGASLGASFGPWGAIIGSLGGAAVGLMRAGEKQLEASEKLSKAIDEEGLGNKAKYERQLEKEARDKKSRDFSKELEGLVGQQDYGRAMELTRTRLDEVKREFERYDEASSSKAIQEQSAKITGNAGFGYKSFDEILARRNELKQTMDGLTSMLESLNDADFKKWSDRDTQARIKQEQEAVARMKARDAEAKERAREEQRLAKATTDKARKERLASLDSSIKGTEGKMSPLQELLGDYSSRLSGYSLTDSLTSVGGGVGYGAQMSGVSTNITNMARDVKGLLDNLQSIKTMLQGQRALVFG